MKKLFLQKKKLNKKYIEDLVMQEIKCFRDNMVPRQNFQKGRGEQVASDYWLCNQIGYIGALLFILDRHSLISLFDEVHNKIREGS